MYGGDESVSDPLVIVDGRLGGLAVDLGKVDVRVLSGRVVTPHGKVLDVSYLGTGLLSELMIFNYGILYLYILIRKLIIFDHFLIKVDQKMK